MQNVTIRKGFYFVIREIEEDQFEILNCGLYQEMYWIWAEHYKRQELVYLARVI